MPTPIILVTDFGLHDPYVGQVKGVLHRLVPGCPVIDLYHDVPSFQVDSGAFVIHRCLTHMPPGVWLCVVDPGGGTHGRGLAVAAAGSWFIGPDNGLLTPIMALPAAQVYGLEHPEEALDRASATFHGRDLFAPVAAALAVGERPLGPVVADFIRLPDQGWCKTADGWSARVMLVDRYGNLITALPGGVLDHASPVRGWVGGQPCGAVVRTFAEVALGESALLAGCYGTVEVVVNQGSAAQRFNVGVGATISIFQS